ncbi:uncharacterized protein [Littorina saxatilis]|uniref:uncharacterized protein n=1 Tax=Littorina saxatilis TaxID=31220 RepID=UPI0038B6B00A
MKTTSTFPLPTLLLLLLSLGELRLAMTSSVLLAPFTVRETGVYIVTMVSDPDGPEQADLVLLINGQQTKFRAYGTDRVVGGLSVAIPLNAGDKVGAEGSGVDAGNSGLRLNIGFVGYDKNFYRTFHCDGGAITNSYGHHYASFNEQYTKTRLWSDVTAYTTTSRYFFDVPKNGPYWVMARPDPPGGGWTSFDIGGRQFQAYSRHGMPTSASAALYLTSQTKLDMELLGTSSMEGATMLSYVYLEGNTPEYLGRSVFHMAFTSCVNKHARMYNADEKVLFSTDANLNMGDLYDSKTGVFSISISGTYIISLRGHPKSGGTLHLSLHRNVHAVFDSHSARGASSGQAAVFDWLAGDKLYVVALGNRNVGPNTMISIALLWKTGAKRERA